MIKGRPSLFGRGWRHVALGALWSALVALVVTRRGRRARAAEFVGGEFAVVVFIECEQDGGGVGDFVGGENAVVVGVEERERTEGAGATQGGAGGGTAALGAGGGGVGGLGEDDDRQDEREGAAEEEPGRNEGFHGEGFSSSMKRLPCNALMWRGGRFVKVA